MPAVLNFIAAVSVCGVLGIAVAAARISAFHAE
jgi:hypothetical protein